MGCCPMKMYIGVCVRKSGHAAVTKPYPCLDDCLNDMKRYVETHFDDMLATTYMVREAPSESFSLLDAFGHPASRDLMKDKKFLKSL